MTEEINQCVICFEDKRSKPQVKLECNHSFCSNCIFTCVDTGIHKCPICRTKFLNPDKNIEIIKVLEENKVLLTAELQRTIRILDIKLLELYDLIRAHNYIKNQNKLLSNEIRNISIILDKTTLNSDNIAEEQVKSEDPVKSTTESIAEYNKQMNDLLNIDNILLY